MNDEKIEIIYQKKYTIILPNGNYTGLIYTVRQLSYILNNQILSLVIHARYEGGVIAEKLYITRVTLKLGLMILVIFRYTLNVFKNATSLDARYESSILPSVSEASSVLYLHT